MKVKEYITKLNKHKKTYLSEVGEYSCYCLDNPKKCFNFINEVYDASHLSEEHFYVIATDMKSNPIGIFDVAHGPVRWFLYPTTRNSNPSFVMWSICCNFNPQSSFW